jgi:CTP synthase
MAKKNRKDIKYIFVTGGVCSGLGKGISSASIGAILKSANYKVFTLKLDPYLNIDPGTMSPYQHGEVYVTDDGTETDLDLGHYERFIDVNLSKLSNLTTGQVYQAVLSEERKGKFLGRTIQIIPHITDEIKRRIYQAAEESQTDILIIEIGGTVGDIEGEPLLEAARQIRIEQGYHNCMFAHVTLLPYIAASNETKTKPTQLSAKELLRRGITPDAIIARTETKIGKEGIHKISMFCNVKPEAVIPAPTVKTIYEVPLNFEKAGISKIIYDHLELKGKKPDLKEWNKLLTKIKKIDKKVTIGLIGKYTENIDAYISVNEALKSACYNNNTSLDLVWVDSAQLEKNDRKELAKLKKLDGLVVPGGFGSRGIEGKIRAAKYARENKVPYLGLCLGSQILAIEYARNVAGLEDANSEEFNPKTKNLIVHYLPGQSDSRAKGGTLRLGAYPCIVKKGTKAYQAYQTTKISERHRHRYEFNNDYREVLEKAGLVISGDSPDHNLMEIVEIKDHPFMLGSQFHPEFKSRPLRAHPLFNDFIKAANKYKK